MKDRISHQDVIDILGDLLMMSVDDDRQESQSGIVLDVLIDYITDSKNYQTVFSNDERFDENGMKDD